MSPLMQILSSLLGYLFTGYLIATILKRLAPAELDHEELGYVILMWPLVLAVQVLMCAGNRLKTLPNLAKSLGRLVK